VWKPRVGPHHQVAQCDFGGYHLRRTRYGGERKKKNTVKVYRLIKG